MVEQVGEKKTCTVIVSVTVAGPMIFPGLDVLTYQMIALKSWVLRQAGEGGGGGRGGCCPLSGFPSSPKMLGLWFGLSLALKRSYPCKHANEKYNEYTKESLAGACHAQGQLFLVFLERATRDGCDVCGPGSWAGRQDVLVCSFAGDGTAAFWWWRWRECLLPTARAPGEQAPRGGKHAAFKSAFEKGVISLIMYS